MNHPSTSYERLSFVSLLVAIALLLQPIYASANPEGGVIAAGQANIITAPTTVDIHQQTHKVVIDWRGFDIAPHERTEFHQPSRSAIALNRVNSNAASTINGTLKANGNIIIVNQNGVLFGKQAVVDVNGLVASSADADTDTFMNEAKVTLDKAGSPDAVIDNQGSITAKESGLVGFVAPRVENSGVITARLGRVHLASGEKATVDFYGDGLLEVAVGDEATHQLARNNGAINAQGGTIALTAAAGRKLLSSGIEVHGTLNAQTATQQEGKIIIAAAGKNAVTNNIAANKYGSNSNVASTVTVKGKLHASGDKAGERGGKITITGDAIALKSGTNISAKGAAGGGVIRIGGEYLGLGTTPTARNASVESGAVIDASATGQGHGGEVILFADGDTIFNGLIYANGAGLRGNGGFVETSGKSRLHIGGAVEAIANHGGLAGQWLLDPADITITAATDSDISPATPFTATATASQLSAATIVAALDIGTNVTVQTNNDGFAGNGDIFVNAPITSTGAGALTISAFRNILVNAAISLNGGALTLRSDNTGIGSGAVSTSAAIGTNGGAITIGGGNGAITAATYNANGSILAAATGYATGNATLANGVTIGGAISAGNNGNIIINGRGFNGTATNVGVEQLAGNAITATGAGTIRISGIAQGTAGNANANFGVALRNNVTTATGVLQVNGQGGNGTGQQNIGVVISSAGGVVRSTGSGAITLSGIGGTSSGGRNHGVVVNNASGVSPTGSGTVLIFGRGGNAGTNNIGVAVNDAGTGSIVGGGGAITINGTGGNTTGSNNYGVALSGTGAGIGVVSNSGTGTITVTGTAAGSGAGGNNYGVLISGTGARISTSGTGAVSVTGTGGGGTVGNNYGVLVNSLGGFTTAGSPISITGQGGSAGGNAVGVIVGSVGSIIAGTSAVTINGTGGLSNGSSSHGVQFNGGGAGTGALTTSGAVNITGIGGGGGATNNNHGIFLSGTGATIAKTGGGAFTVTGTGGTGSGGNNHGIHSTIGDGITSAANATLNATAGSGGGSAGIVSTIANGIRTTGAATLTLLSNSFNITSGSAVNSNSTLTVAPLTAVTFGLGTGAGVATINNASLGNLAATTGYIFGSATTPDITVNTTAPFTSRALTFTSSGNITLNNGFQNLTSLTTTAPSGTTTINAAIGGVTAIGAYTATGLDLLVNASLRSSAAINATFSNDITVAGAATLTAGGTGALSLRANNGATAGSGGALLINGNLAVGTGAVTLRSSANTSGVRPNWTATAANFTSTGTFGALDIQGFDDITLNTNIASSGNILMYAFDDLLLNAVNTLTTGGGGALDLRANNGIITGTGGALLLNGNVSVGTGAVTLLSSASGAGVRPDYTITSTNFVPQSTFGAIDIQGFRDTTVNTNINSSGSISILSIRDLTLNAVNSLTTGPAGGLTLQAANNVVLGSGDLNLNGTISVGTGALTLRSGSRVARPNWTATSANLILQNVVTGVGAVNISGFLDTVIDRDLISSAGITITGFRDLTVNMGRTITSGAASGLTLQAANNAVGATGRLNLNGTLSNGTGGLTLLSGTTRPTYTATTTNLVRQGLTFGTINIQGFANFTVDRELNSNGNVTFANNTQTTLRNNITSTTGDVSFNTTNPLVVAEGFSPTISTGGGTITFAGSTIADTVGGLTEGLTLSAGTGTITSNSTIDGVALNANAGTIILTGVLGGVRPLGNSLITSTIANQLILPSITALSLNAATTAAGSQLTINGPIFTTGASGLSLSSAGSVAKTGAGNLSTVNAPLSLTAANNLFFNNAGTNLNSGGGVITLNGPAGIVNAQSLTVNSGNGNLNMNGPVIIGAPLVLNLGAGTANFSSTINALQNISASVQALVVAGGGGGGNNGGGGGGAGGFQYNATVAVTSGTLVNVTVGAGGAAAVSNTVRGSNGGNSSFGVITSLGGSGGASRDGGGAPLSGGSGGGGAGVLGANAAGATGGAGTVGQGNNGSNGTPSDLGVNAAGGGGGGAGGLGTAGASTLGGNGGAGVSNSITGSAVTYAGGGAGGVTLNGTGGTGGLGGGGSGGRNGTPATAGASNTGGGGGGNGPTGSAGAGGSGVVIVRYTGTTTNGIVVGGTSTTVGADTVWTFNSSGSFTPISGCNGACSLTVNAANVNFGGTLGGTNPLGDVIINSTNAFTLPSLSASSLAVTGNTNLNGNILINNGPATFNSPIVVTGSSNINTGTGTVTFASTVNGANNLTVDAGTVSLGAAVGGITPLANLAITTTNALNISHNISAATILARTTGAASDIAIDAGRSLTASGTGNAITLVSGRHFTNNSGLGLATMNLTGGGRYLIYSVQPSSDMTGGLVRDFRRFSCSFASVGSCLFNATINNTVTIPTAGNGFIYSSTPGTLTLNISNIGNVIYGNTVNLVGLATDPTTLGQYINASDFANDVITGSITGATTYVPGPTNGGLGTYNLNYASGALVSALGYDVVIANNPNAFTVIPRTVTVSVVGPISRVYNGTLAATLTAGNYAIGNIFTGDILGISNTLGTYDTKNAGTGKTVTVTGLTLTGTPVANYVLASTTATGAVGEITQRALTIGAVAANRVYNGLTTASVVLNDDRVAGDGLTTGFGAANFDDRNVGNGKTVTVTGITLGGADAANYTFNTSATTTANITQRALTIGAVAANRVYDGLTNAAVVLNDNRVSGDALTTGFGAANFDNRNAGNGKTVTVTGITLGGGDAANYTFNTSATTTANILRRVLTIDVVAANKAFDGNTLASVILSDDRLAGDVLAPGFTAANFASSLPATGITVTVSGITLSGADAANYSFNTTAFTTADITGVAPPPADPTTPLPNTVVRVTQNTGEAVTAPTDDGIYASPATTYQLIYLPANAPAENRILNRAPVVSTAPSTLTTAFVLPDEEKRLRNARKKRTRSLLARGSRTFIFDANIPSARRPGGFEASPQVKSI